MISITPPVDAFTVSQTSQTNLLKETLEKNQMLEENKLIPNADVSKEDKIKISQTIYYLTDMDYTEDIKWLAPYGQQLTYQFEEIFGFQPIYGETGFVNNQPAQDAYYATLDRQQTPVISIEDYDKMIAISYYEFSERSAIEFEVGDSTYAIETQGKEGKNLVLMDENKQSLMSIDLQEAMEQVATTTQTENLFTIEEGTVVAENEQVEMKVLFTSIDIYDDQYNSEFYLFVDVK